jgi:hypothetical protein
MKASGKSREISWRTVGIICAVMFAGSLVPFIAPDRVGDRDPKSKAETACRANLLTLEGAKTTWAYEFGLSPSNSPSLLDLIGPDKHIHETPVCPAGGSYAIGTFDEKSRCSIRGHTLKPKG